MNRTLLTTALSAAFVLGAPAVLAQSAESGSQAATIVAQSATPTPNASNAQRGPQAQHQFQLPSQRVEARLTRAHDALKITAQQQVMWDNFANVMRRHAREMDQRIQEHRAQTQEGQARPQVSAIARLERAQQRSATHAEHLTELLGAAKPLYATFSDEQKRVADQMMARGPGGQGGPHRHHHRGMQRPTA